MSSEIENIGYDKFSNSEKRIENFKKNLYIYEQNSSNSFYFAILYGARFILIGKNNFSTDQKEIEINISKNLFD